MVYILISAKLFRSLLVNLKKDRIMTGKEFPSVVYQRVTIISLSCLYPLPVCETWWHVSKHGISLPMRRLPKNLKIAQLSLSYK